MVSLQRAVGNRAAARQLRPISRQVLARGTYASVVKKRVASGPTYRLDLHPRPDNQRAALPVIINTFWPKVPDVSEKERELYDDAGGNAGVAKLLVKKHAWLKNHQAAVCHKLAISVFREHLRDWVANLFDDICFGTPAEGDSEMTDLIAAMTATDPQHPARRHFAQLVGYRSTVLFGTPRFTYATNISHQVDSLCDLLIDELNRAHDNLYIGFAPTNSSLQESFDPHVPIDPADPNDVQATPRSRGIYDAEHAFAAAYGKEPSSPRRDLDAYATSSLNAAAGQIGMNYPGVGFNL